MALFGAAVVSKEHTVTLPALLLLTDYFFNPGFSFEGIKRNWRLYLVVGIGLLFGLVMVWAASESGHRQRRFSNGRIQRRPIPLHPISCLLRLPRPLPLSALSIHRLRFSCFEDYPRPGRVHCGPAHRHPWYSPASTTAAVSRLPRTGSWRSAFSFFRLVPSFPSEIL